MRLGWLFWLLAAILHCIAVNCQTYSSKTSEVFSKFHGTSDNLSAILHQSDKEAGTVLYDNERQKKLDYYIKTHANCSRNAWYCFADCRLRRDSSSATLCSQPDPTAQCFGINVSYKYVKPDTNIIKMLPRYEILSRFPRCWAVLAPLICAITYRPCSVRKSFQSYQSDESKVEFWQLFRWSMCDRAMSECAFVRDWGLWPEFINCASGSVKKPNRDHLFANDSCLMPYKEAPSNFERHQCFWPLIKSEEKFRDAQPLVDDCYLPCQSTLVSSTWTRSRFRMEVLILSAIFCVVFLLLFIYLSFFSEVWRTNMCAYVLGHALFSGFLYYLLWSLSFFDWIAESAMCVGNGELRRNSDNSLGKTIGWCGIQSFFMQTMFSSIYLWLCAFLFFRIGRPHLRFDHRILSDGNPDWSLRCILLVLYLIAAIAALPAFWLSKAESDGLLGVCYVGLRTSGDRIWIYFPVVFATVFFLIWALFFLIVKRKTNGSEGKDDTLGCLEDTSATPETHEARLLVGSELRNGYSAGEIGREESVDDGFASGQISETPEKEELISESRGNVLSKRTPLDVSEGCGYSAVSNLFLGVICFAYLLSLATTLVVHLRNEWNAEIEKELILKSQRCSLNASILEGKAEWFNDARHSDHLVASVDPLVRKKVIGARHLNAPECDLVPLLDDYFYPLLLMYVIMPSLPLIAVVVLLVSGWCGFGFKDIEKVREILNPFVRTARPPGNELQEVCKSEYTGLDELPRFSSSGRVASWCETGTLPKRYFSSADCLNREKLLSSNSVPSQINSEPVQQNSFKSRIRKLDFKRLAQLRMENARNNSISVQSTGGTSYSGNEQLLSQRSSAASLTSEIPSVYSQDFPMNCRSCNTPSASQFRDSNMEAATVLSAYQTGLIEGFWQQMCNEYAGKINTLAGCLREAEEEIRRLSGQPDTGETPQHPMAQAANPTFGLPTRNGFPLFGLSLLQASGLVAGMENNLTNYAPATSDLSSRSSLLGSGATLARSVPLKTAEDSVEALDGAPVTIRTKKEHRSGSVKAESNLNKSGEKADAKEESVGAIRDENRNETVEKLNDAGTVDDKESKRSTEADSNSFVSDEEDEEEAKLWEEKTAEIQQTADAGPSSSEQSKKEQRIDLAKQPLTVPNSEMSSGAGDRSKETGGSQYHYVLPSLKPHIPSQVQTGGGLAGPEVPTRGGLASAGYRGVSAPEQQAHRQVRGVLFGASRPLANVPGQLPNGPANMSGPRASGPNRAPTRPVMLTEEQARGLLNLRNQLTVRDLLYYSNRLREEALRRTGNQEGVAGQRLQRVNHQPRQAESIREEEEEVPDPFSSTDGTDVSSSQGTARSSSRDRNNGGDPGNDRTDASS